MYIRLVQKDDTNENGYIVLAIEKIKCKDTSDFFRRSKEIIDNILLKNNIELFEYPVCTYNIKEIFGNNGYESSYFIPKGGNDSYTGISTFTLSANKVTEDIIHFQNCVVLNNNGKMINTDVFLGVDLYDEGYILSIGKKVSNVFGVTSDGYLSKITSANVRYGNRSGAKIFTPKQMLDFINKHQYVFELMVKKKGWEWNFEPVNYFTEESFESYSDKKKLKTSEILDNITVLLDEINNTSVEEVSVQTADSEIDEAILRMKEMEMLPNVINDFKKCYKLYQSEAGGILYDIDEEAQVAVEKCKKHGLPYHVIKTGAFYSVLYVSNYRDDWPLEHFNIQHGYIPAYVYNSDDPILSEIGDIGILPCNGGINRVW